MTCIPWRMWNWVTCQFLANSSETHSNRGHPAPQPGHPAVLTLCICEMRCIYAQKTAEQAYATHICGTGKNYDSRSQLLFHVHKSCTTCDEKAMCRLLMVRHYQGVSFTTAYSNSKLKQASTFRHDLFIRMWNKKLWNEMSHQKVNIFWSFTSTFARAKLLTRHQRKFSMSLHDLSRRSLW